MMTLNYGLSGYVCSRVAIPLVRPLLRDGFPLPERGLAWACFLGAMLPDIDAVMNLLGSAYYFSDAWYGHRNASHSILGTLILSLLAAWPLALRYARRRAPTFRRAYVALVPAFWAGGLLHILGDLFTPRRPLPVFWPLEFELGAFSHIGWLSPYLLWLFLAAIAIDLGIRWSRGRRGGASSSAAGGSTVSGWRAVAVWGVYAFAAGRWIVFLAESRYESNAQWWAYHYRLLPAALVDPLASGVSAAWFWMTR